MMGGEGRDPRGTANRGTANPAVDGTGVPNRAGQGDAQAAGTVAVAGQPDAPKHKTRAGDGGREALRILATALFQAQWKADALAKKPLGGEGETQQRLILDDHLRRITDWLTVQFGRDTPEITSVRAIEVGAVAANLAADLMYLDRTGVAAGGTTASLARRGANQGLPWAWKAMRELKADPSWAVKDPAEVREALDWAARHRDITGALIPDTVLLKSGVDSAQIADFVVNAPQLLATGNSILRRLAAWMRGGGGGGTGTLAFAVAGGSRTFTLISDGRAIVLTAEELEALIRAGILGNRAAALYHMMTSGPGTAAGPFGLRPPGSKSRYTDEEIAKEYLREIGKKVPTGERAVEELGVVGRNLRKMDEYHHLLVQQLRKWFKARGVDIDKYTLRLSADEHRWIHNEYRWNDLWKDFMRNNPDASPREIIDAMRRFMKQVGLEGLGDPVPYPR